MSDPQQPQVPPYAPQMPPQGFPDQPHHPAQPPSAQHAAPRQPAQGYVLNGQSIQSAPSGANPAGRTGLILGFVALAISLVTSILVQVLIRAADYSMFGAYSVVNGIGSLLALGAAVAALILGLIGIRRVGAPHAAAGVAVGIGIAQIISILFGWLSTVVGSFLYF